MKWKEPPVFYGTGEEADRAELRRLVKERDAKIRPEQWPTVISEEEMQDKKRLGMTTKGYITLTAFNKKIRLENPNFILHRKTLQQELDEKKFFEELARE